MPPPIKITTADKIKDSERELLDTIIGDLDWTVIEDIIQKRHHLKIQDDIEYKHGDIINFNKNVAYKLDFDVRLTLSIIFDRNGNPISVQTEDEFSDEPVQQSDNPDGINPDIDAVDVQINGLAAEVADLLHKFEQQ